MEKHDASDMHIKVDSPPIFRIGNLAHQGIIISFGCIIRGIVREIGYPIKRTVILRKIYPAFITWTPLINTYSYY